MLKIILTVLIFCSTASYSLGANEKLAEALRLVELSLSSNHQKKIVPLVKWQSLKKFEEKLYFTIAHDPSGIPASEVPASLRSTSLTSSLRTDWEQLENEALFYGLDESVKEWSSFKKLLLSILDLRDQNFFNQSRKPLKSGALTKSIDDLSSLWSIRWYQQNPNFIVSLDKQQIDQLKELVSKARAELSKGDRSPAGEQRESRLPIFPSVALVFIFLTVAYLLGKKHQVKEISVFKEAQLTNASFLNSFDYEEWVKEFSSGIEFLVKEREVRSAFSSEFSEVSNTLRELRVGILMATTDEEFHTQAQKLIDVGLKLENLLENQSENEESLAFDKVMKTVIRLCVVLEKKQSDEFKIAA